MHEDFKASCITLSFVSVWKSAGIVGICLRQCLNILMVDCRGNMEMWKSVMVMFCYSGGSVEMWTFTLKMLAVWKYVNFNVLIY